MKFTIPRFVAGLMLAASLLSVPVMQSGCNKSTLEPGGAYAPDPITNAVTGVVTQIASDKAFFVVDSSFELAYAVVTAAFDYERDNRAALWAISHDIKHNLDNIRKDATIAKNEYLKARAAYKANPTPAGLDTLNNLFAKIQQVSTAANSVIPDVTKALSPPK